jgi:hypothetical protein
MWAAIEPLLPPVMGPMERPMRGHRLLVEAAVYRYRCGSRGVIITKICALSWPIMPSAAPVAD